MNIKQIRRLNLKQLIDSEFDGKAIDLAKAMGLGNANNLYRVLNDNSSSRGIGHQMSASIERAAGKPKGWLDVLHDNSIMEDIAPYKSNRRFNVISTENIMEWIQSQTESKGSIISIPGPWGPKTFVLKVFDNANFPDFISEPHSYLWVDPDETAKDKDFSVYCLNGVNIGIYLTMVANNKTYLKTTNPALPSSQQAIEVPEDAIYCGKVVFHGKFY